MKVVTLFFTVIGYNIRIFVNDRELVSGYLISTLINSFACGFQGLKQEMSQLKLVLQSNVNSALLV